MLAKIDWNTAPCDPLPETEYSGYPDWEVFLAEPNKERRICDFLKDKLGIVLYWPHYTIQRTRRGRTQMPSARSVLPGMLFAPIEFLQINGRNRILDWVRIRPLRLARFVDKAEIEMIRDIEARLNIRFQGYTDGMPALEVGQAVRFRNDVYADKLGDAVVTKVAPGGRISIKVEGKLFGGKQDMVVSAGELEAK
ncbi:MAG: hypothetical protein Q8M26_08795 [Pseudolabrys sp.]|nr:hypothetical protein [Pseudolabrys sp.]